MRVALLAESFLPHMNGVTNSVLQVLAHLERHGHEAMVIAPGSGGVRIAGSDARTEQLRSVPLPSYPQVRVTVATTPQVTGLLAQFAPDVVHLASPLVLGWHGQAAANLLRVPTVAVYQTDVIAYAASTGFRAALPSSRRTSAACTGAAPSPLRRRPPRPHSCATWASIASASGVEESTWNASHRAAVTTRGGRGSPQARYWWAMSGVWRPRSSSRISAPCATCPGCGW